MLGLSLAPFHGLGNLPLTRQVFFIMIKNVICPHCKNANPKECEVCQGEGKVTPWEWAAYKSILRLLSKDESANG